MHESRRSRRILSNGTAALWLLGVAFAALHLVAGARYGFHRDEQIELAKRSRVAIGTVRRMESFRGEIGARTSTLSQVQKALEKAGVEFLNHEQPGVRLKHVAK
jgi:hypothetical protein